MFTTISLLIYFLRVVVNAIVNQIFVSISISGLPKLNKGKRRVEGNGKEISKSHLLDQSNIYSVLFAGSLLGHDDRLNLRDVVLGIYQFMLTP